MSRVFINQIDSYLGSFLADTIGHTHIGSIREDILELHSEDQASRPELCYQVSGTHCSTIREDNIYHDLLSTFEYNELPKILEQDVIIYNICDDINQIVEAEFVVNNLHQNIDQFLKPKTFILISTCLTWAKTRPVDPDEPDGVYTEDDYRMRRSHPSFKDHLALEKLVTKLGRTKKNSFSTYVLCCGLIYGGGESILHFLFKQAWLGEFQGLQLPIFGNGQNNLPTIHIRDLVSIIVNLVELHPKPRYLLAVDMSNNTLEEIVKSISSELGTGNIRNVSREESFLIQDVDLLLYDTLLVNLRMDSRYIKENMNFQWQCDTGFVENISSIVSEYKKRRNLLPLKMCIFGPPASGKTTIAKLISIRYKIHHILIGDVIQEQIQLLENLASRTSLSDVGEDYETRAEQARDLLETLKENSNNNSGRYTDNFVIDFVKSKLNSKPCQNQGYILDGFPKTLKQAQEIFGTLTQLLDTDEEKSSNYYQNILPDYIIQLDSTEEFLRHRLISLPQNMVEGTHDSEEGFFRRFSEYQNINSLDSTVLNLFDEFEILISRFDISQVGNLERDYFLHRIIDIIGIPKNYGPTAEELVMISQKEEDDRILLNKNLLTSKFNWEIEEAAIKCTNEAIWTAQTNAIQLQQLDFLRCQSMPLRNYLMSFVMPTLTRGLVSISKSTPDDPIDYLAEFLFKNNPCIA